MTRDDALAQLEAELRGLLMEAYADARATAATFEYEKQLAAKGQAMTRQLSHARNLFRRIVVVAAGPAIVDEPVVKVTKPTNGTNGNPVAAQPR